jgi:hypothetical protein
MNLGETTLRGNAHAGLVSYPGAHSGRYLFLGLSERVPGIHGLVRPPDKLIAISLGSMLLHSLPGVWAVLISRQRTVVLGIDTIVGALRPASSQASRAILV